ncbi:MAG: glycine rich domain-containing protein [Cellulosilyticum sp.]|nr:glycine rich domain-containing protein [Cellulosilyticum sp.]
MATKTIAWTTGSGNITLTYTGQGNGSISVSSSENDLFEDREQSFGIVTTAGSPEKSLSILVRQKGKSYPVGEVFNFAYTGSVQQITLPKGKYKLQCWGAQGGSVTGSYAIAGSKGGYSEGIITLTKTTTFYIFVGGQGTSYTSSASQTSTTVINGGWNGGGAGIRTSRYNSGDTDGRSFPRGGGGATDISTVTSALSYSSGRTTRDSASLLARCIVAGGGAGASARYTQVATTSSSWVSVYSGQTTYSWQSSASGRAYTHFSSYNFTTGNTYKVEWSIQGSVSYISLFSGGTLVSQINITSSSFTFPSKSYDSVEIDVRVPYTPQPLDVYPSFVLYENRTETSTSSSSGKSSASQQGGGTSGKGQYPGTQTSAGSGGAFGLGASQSSTNYRYCGGAGGGGWYGGGTGVSDSSTSYVNYSGGGSGFVNTAANASSRPSGYTGLQLDSGTTTAGSSSFPSTSGGTETGHSGNGYARITVIE